MWVGGQRHTSTVLPPGKRPGTHRTGGRVGPRAGLDECGAEEISLHRPGFETRTVKNVASRYTDYAIPAAAGVYSRPIFLEMQSQHITNTDEKYKHFN